MPTIRQLEYLVALDDLGHFGRAAARCHVSQPTLSQQLRQLEQRLGVTLVERGSPPGMTPTGREIAARARRVLTEVNDIRQLAQSSQGGMAGTIRFGITPTLGPYLMPTAIVRLHREFPDLRLYIREGIPDQQLADLARGEIDMMLCPLPVTEPALQVEPLFREPIHLIAAPDHALSIKSNPAARDFAGEPFLSIDPAHHFHRQAEAICADLGAQLLRDYQGTSLDSLRQMAGSGLGLALLPELYLRAETGGSDMVKKLQVSDWSASRSIAAVWRERTAFADTYRRISDLIADEARTILEIPAG
ncbi:hydrogen peroxide-inducible genes activator [Parerythrobacter jejuensis]|uniref:LysR family transcriptional regulator n=1 Tax=Parerythrobacter jejuensis TaxID=795812 RepID=A0A845AYA1_9SPHN|nr:hydrogen peroxide-inducible genes activator [Parerythrobacter jejuensis]MXP31738.1 LysR family transcriptional regulator [Parerythrobacter jejuensis]